MAPPYLPLALSHHRLHGRGQTLTGKRNRAILAILLGCGLRHRELTELTLESLQRREERWAIVDLMAKGRHIRTVPPPNWVKATLDAWLTAAGIEAGPLFRSLCRAGKGWGLGISETTVWQVVKKTAACNFVSDAYSPEEAVWLVIHFLLQTQAVALDLLMDKRAFLVTREQSAQVAQRRARLLWQCGERVQQAGLLVAVIHHDDPEDFYAVQPVGLRCEEGAALLHGGANERVVILRVRDCGPVALEENLIEAAPVVEGTQSCFEPLDRVIPASVVQALVVDPADAKRRAEVAGLREKAMLIPKAVQVHLGGKRACLFPVLRDVLNLDHRASQCGVQACPPSWGRTVCGTCRS